MNISDSAPGAAAGSLHLHSLGIHLLYETTCQGGWLSHSLAKVVTDQKLGRFASTVCQAFRPIFPPLRSTVGILLKAMLPDSRCNCPGHQVGIVASSIAHEVAEPQVISCAMRVGQGVVLGLNLLQGCNSILWQWILGVESLVHCRVEELSLQLCACKDLFGGTEHLHSALWQFLPGLVMSVHPG